MSFYSLLVCWQQGIEEGKALKVFPAIMLPPLDQDGLPASMSVASVLRDDCHPQNLCVFFNEKSATRNSENGKGPLDFSLLIIFLQMSVCPLCQTVHLMRQWESLSRLPFYDSRGLAKTALSLTKICLSEEPKSS